VTPGRPQGPEVVEVAEELAEELGSWPGLAGPGNGLPPPFTITIWATAAAPIITKSTMIMMKV
jgi:hypothetical protein